MTPTGPDHLNLTQLAETLAARGEAHAIATVIRTTGATSAKPGAKALLRADGTIAEGWIGGGCVRAALAKAAARAFEAEEPQLISLQPSDQLEQKGLQPGDDVEGVRFARNGCPSQGTMDIFVEPVMPRPELVVIGSSPVARAVTGLAAQFDWVVTPVGPDASIPPQPQTSPRMVVIATQGKGDLAALRHALDTTATYVGFVASRKKFAHLADKLRSEGLGDAQLNRVEAPAGLPIAAVTPDEIALSILARLTHLRRDRQRLSADNNGLSPLTQPPEAAS